MSGSRWQGWSDVSLPRVSAATICGMGSRRSANLMVVGCVVGMGSEIGHPSKMGLGQPPKELSKPLRLKIMRMAGPIAFVREVAQWSERQYAPLAWWPDGQEPVLGSACFAPL